MVGKSLLAIATLGLWGMNLTAVESSVGERESKIQTNLEKSSEELTQLREEVQRLQENLQCSKLIEHLNRMLEAGDEAQLKADLDEVPRCFDNSMFTPEKLPTVFAALQRGIGRNFSEETLVTLATILPRGQENPSIDNGLFESCYKRGISKPALAVLGKVLGAKLTLAQVTYPDHIWFAGQNTLSIAVTTKKSTLHYPEFIAVGDKAVTKAVPSRNTIAGDCITAQIGRNITVSGIGKWKKNIFSQGVPGARVSSTCPLGNHLVDFHWYYNGTTDIEVLSLHPADTYFDTNLTAYFDRGSEELNRILLADTKVRSFSTSLKNSLLMIYAMYGKSAVSLREIFRQGEPSQKNSQGYSAWQLALLYNRSPEMLEAMLELTSDADLRTAFPPSQLYYKNTQIGGANARAVAEALGHENIVAQLDKRGI